MRLVNGKVSYSDARTQKRYAADAINMRVSLPSLAEPLDADGSLVWNGEKVALKLTMKNPQAFLDGKTTELSSSISSSLVKLDFKGNTSKEKQLRASGSLTLDVPSVRKLAAWAGQPMTAPGNGFGPLKIIGQVSVDGQKYQFTSAKLALDKINATGDFRYDGSGKRPYVNARLDTGPLDINPYLPPEEDAKGKTKKPSPAGAGSAAQQGWSDAPIDLSGLRQADADAVLKVAGLQVRKIKIGELQVKLTLKNGRLVTELTKMALYTYFSADR